MAERLAEVGRFGSETLAERVRRHAVERPDAFAFVGDGQRLTWSDVDELADRLAAGLVAAGAERGDRIAILFPDGPVVHALYLATERAGVVAVGVPARAGDQEVQHLVGLTGSTVLVTAPEHAGRDTATLAVQLGFPAGRHLVVDPDRPGAVRLGAVPWEGGPRVSADRALGLGDLFVLNSTSGTTGMPKCVAHHQNRLLYYYTQATLAGDLTEDDVILSVVPTPYGFGLWSAHATPILLGATAVRMRRFDAAAAMRLIAAERATVLAAVTTQFVMMLNADPGVTVDARSLRCMFTGGEAIPYRRGLEFEERTGAALLQFYGSNETGMLSCTTVRDDQETRLTSAGRVVPDMRVRLSEGVDGGRSSCRGPAASLGYYADPRANAELFDADGWMLTGDRCTIDAQDRLRVVGRVSDFIIRGGKNISALAVEERVGEHPAVEMVAAIGVPDEVFGERVCAVIELRPGAELSLPDLCAFLAHRGVSKETWPERLEIVDEMPCSAGGKIAKAELRRRWA
ncbi:class I adenylate-forming enzyme family protein [Saccharopolyspora sp. NPDC050389]|uniref:class I adenylate-forming enzyme family protein n=1 Tax=Saccharopolyspora sp. NPDC050389 TaxID=3155516 RepID=UPI0033ED0036